MDDFEKVLDEARDEGPAVKTQDDPNGRPWTWEEDGFTVIRSNARSGPGCHENCGVLMYVKDGVLEKIEGDPDNPFNQGRLCPRCLAFKEMLYHEDRLKYPLKRKKEDRGKNTFERISWDEAYDIIEREMKAVIDKYGARSIWVTQGTGRDINGYGPLMAQRPDLFQNPVLQRHAQLWHRFPVGSGVLRAAHVLHLVQVGWAVRVRLFAVLPRPL